MNCCVRFSALHCKSARAFSELRETCPALGAGKCAAAIHEEARYSANPILLPVKENETFWGCVGTNKSRPLHDYTYRALGAP